MTTRDLRHQQQRPQPGREPAHPDAGRRLAGADRLHLPRRPPPHLRSRSWSPARRVASFIPYIGTAVYAIVRPPEFLEDAHERELEIKAAELRVRQLDRALLPAMRLPGREELPALPRAASAGSRTPARAAVSRSIPRWALCPYCETALSSARAASPNAGRPPGKTPAAPAERKPAPRESAATRAPPGAAETQTTPKEPRT